MSRRIGLEEVSLPSWVFEEISPPSSVAQEPIHAAREVFAPLQGQGLAAQHCEPAIGAGFSDHCGGAQR